MEKPSTSTCRFDDSSGITFRTLEENDLIEISSIFESWIAEFIVLGALDYPDYTSSQQLRERLQNSIYDSLIAVNTQVS